MSDYKCKVGDIVLYKGKKVSVSEVLVMGTDYKEYYNGNESLVRVRAKKAIISVCRVMTNGQILTRSPFYVGDNWEHK